MTELLSALAAEPAAALALGGLLIGFFYGAVAGHTGFCTLGAVSDVMYIGDGRRLAAWGLALAIALAAVAALTAAGYVRTDLSMYAAPRLTWAGYAVGGLMFGSGMAMAGGCTSRAVVRAGGGDLRAGLTLLVVGLSAYAAIGGVLGPLRRALEETWSSPLAAPTQRLSDLLFAPETAAGPTTGLAIAALLAAGAFLYPPFRASRRHVAAGFGIGCAVAAGWALTGGLHDDMADKVQPPQSLSFVRPVGDAIEWLERQTALGLPGFGAATIFGTFAGSLAAAVAAGRFQLATFAGTGDTLRHIGGGILMGVGGVMALGCSVGQGITGLSTLAVGSFVATLFIVAGTIIGLKALERWAA